MIKTLQPYKIMVDFLADYLGEDTEVVLHDLTDRTQSIVAIRNGHISGRRIGTPLTDFARDLIDREVYKTSPYCVNYKGISPRGETIRSATYFIYDDNGELVGMLCINTNCQKMIDMRDMLNKMIVVNPEKRTMGEAEENFNIDVADLVANNLKRIFPVGHKELTLMTKQEKTEVCEKLQEMGTFLVKGTIGHVAEILGVSVPTIYRYLATIKRENGEK